MFIELHELELHPVDFEEEFRPGAIDLGPDVVQTAPLATAGRAQLIEEHYGKHQTIKDIRVDGKLKTTVEVPCARCLEAVNQNVARSFDLLYRPQGVDAGREETSVSGTDAEISYYQGEGLELEDVIREQVLLALPLKALCKEDCRGLCPHCGLNLNQQACSCAEQPPDPRWSALKDLREKLNH